MNEAQKIAKERAEIMLAFANGKKILCKYSKREEELWTDHANPAWDWLNWDYKLAPETVEIQLFRHVLGDTNVFIAGTELNSTWTPVSDIIKVEVKDVAPD